MIFWDCGMGENLLSRLGGHGNIHGPVTTESLLALYQEPGAILLSTNTLRNILELGTFFKDFLEKDIEYLTKKYGRYDRFRDEKDIDYFSKACKYVNENYNKLVDLAKNSSTRKDLYEKIKDDPFFESEKSGTFSNLPACTTYLMCAYFPFDRYVIKELGSFGYLFIPNSYLNKLSIDPTSLKENNGIVDETEMQLGIKINHLANIKVDLESIKNQKGFLLKDCHQSFVQLLNLIFVKNNDVKDSLILKPWAIYWCSHGMFKQEFTETVQKMKDIKKKITQLTDETNNLKKNYSANEKNSNYTKSAAGKQLDNKIKLEEYNLLQLKYERFTLRWTKQAYATRIGGLNLQEFKKALIFFNTKIITGFLFYTSCFAGGQLAIDAYKNETQNTLSDFNYTIATDSSFDVPTRKEIIISSLNAYFNKAENQFNEKKLLKIIDFSEKRIVLHSNINYRNFFKQLEEFPLKSSSYLELFANVNPLLANFQIRLRNKDWVQALPSIRFPGTTWFNTVELPKNVVQLTKIKVLARGNEPLVIDQKTNKKRAILLYTNDIPFEVIIKSSPKKYIPSIVSMNPGTAVHVLESLDVSEFDLSKTLLSFFPFGEFSGSKLFLIKKLKAITNLGLGTYKNQPHVFENVMIVFNGKLEEQDPFSNFIFFTGPYNHAYSYKWQAGSRLPDTFYTKLDKKAPKDYKERLLKYFETRIPSISDGKFSGILDTTEGREKISFDTVKKLFEKRINELKELNFKMHINQLSYLNQSLSNLESQSSKI